MRRETVFLALTPTLRLRIETTIENLLALLDEIDGEEDLEDSGDTELNGDEGDFSQNEDDSSFIGESDPTARPAAKQALRRLRAIERGQGH